MRAGQSLLPARRITVYCPVAPETLTAVARGDFTLLAQDAGISPILELIEQSEEFGNFGRYRGVCEIGFGLEAFTPQATAVPTIGRAGERSQSPTLAVTTFVLDGVTEDRLGALVEAIAERHPWEIPVIEVFAVGLYTLPAA
jgi:hypothetical protein